MLPLKPVKRLSEAGLKRRQNFEYVTISLAPNQMEAFTFECGMSAIIQRLEVDSPAVVQMWGHPEYDTRVDPNPYTFRATADHLMDDGSTALRDGTIIKTRQYSIFTNLETPSQPQVYGTITNIGTTLKKITLKIQYLTVEEF